MERHFKNSNENCIQLLSLVCIFVGFFLKIPSVVLKYENYALKGIIKRKSCRTALLICGLMPEVYLTQEMQMPIQNRHSYLKGKAVVKLLTLANVLCFKNVYIFYTFHQYSQRNELDCFYP